MPATGSWTGEAKVTGVQNCAEHFLTTKQINPTHTTPVSSVSVISVISGISDISCADLGVSVFMPTYQDYIEGAVVHLIERNRVWECICG